MQQPIQSGQVIVNLCSVAKELVENSIDAGATSIEVRFKNQGLDSVEVQDNGYGISTQNYEGLALKHYTSKLSKYDDLDTLQTFGFRGEALSSLCALSHFSVVTCLAADVPKGTRLDFETSGRLKGTSVVAAQKGTTVTVEKLFFNLPVRRRELERNVKREWGKVVSLLNQYACIQTGVKFTVSQQPSKGKRVVLFSTKGNATTRDNLINIFGAKTMTSLIQLGLTMELELTRDARAKWTSPVADGGGGGGSIQEIRVEGYVSRPAHGQGRQTPDRQMFFVNGRPCKLPQFAQLFGEVYRTYNTSQAPFIFADIQLDTHLYDVNVSPDKQTILLHDQGKMLDNLRESLIELFEKQEITMPTSQLSSQKITAFRKPAASQASSPSSALAEKSDRAAVGEQETQPKAKLSRTTQSPSSPPRSGHASDDEEIVYQLGPRKRGPPSFARVTIGNTTVSTSVLSSSKRLKVGSSDGARRPMSTETQCKTRTRKALPSFGGTLTQMFSSLEEDMGAALEDEAGQMEGVEPDEMSQSGSDRQEKSSEAVPIGDDEDEQEGPEDGQDQEVDTRRAEGPETEEDRRSQLFLKSGGSKKRYETLRLVQTVRASEAAIEKMATSRQRWRLPGGSREEVEGAGAAGDNDGDDDRLDEGNATAAEEKLALTIAKSDFGQMRVVGQFNLGFILAVRRGGREEEEGRSRRLDDDELFIIDQHASDEKYNFERLRATTTLQSQRLVQPKRLSLTAVEEEVVFESRAVLAANGFVVDVVVDGSEPVGARCRLLTLPLSRETTFDLGDLEELIALLAEHPGAAYADNLDCLDLSLSLSSTPIPRPAKVRRMLAMRACRSSIMVGRALSHRQMAAVLAHMGHMDKPWNCPHGRPTMRHLGSLGRVWDGGRGWHEDDVVQARPRPDWPAFLKKRKGMR
ncbi:DNA mismatch repair protein [Grosmannia clavigera kw1407]|uniref:DNA mismatch repair protein PMS1 n=1 Tax=Grosmannia clavigera (strain kw1407 / UAMH 11150) TaxID=655863 RepID=F0XFU8_GROCL|nr:DNA mismatch repair protein [Grosmannia clavigera kw1407]EFX04708.1 DNA mismatch repair protein [Grosmannia clavigera kw1407]